MPPKSDNAEKTPTLKGQAAESAILSYIKKCNRPYGSADVSANLKNAVSKPATQKILLALAEKSDIKQKTYGKQTFFVAKQEDLEDMPPEKLDAFANELKIIEEEIKALTSSNKALAMESAKLRSTPTDADLPGLLAATQAEQDATLDKLSSFRELFELPSASDIEKMDADWAKWREEWKMRKKVFREIWSTITESLAPDQADDLAESLGIEYDSPAHDALEKSALCNPPVKSRARK